MLETTNHSVTQGTTGREDLSSGQSILGVYSHSGDVRRNVRDQELPDHMRRGRARTDASQDGNPNKRWAPLMAESTGSQRPSLLIAVRPTRSITAGWTHLSMEDNKGLGELLTKR